MPRDGSGIYTIPPGTHGIPDTTIASTPYNLNVDDVATDLNAPRPIVAGGTGASTAANARTNLQAERSNQIVTNYASQVWEFGSFSSAAGATAAPSANAFSGIAYGTDSNNLALEARDQTTGIKYVNRKVGGTWQGWAVDASDRYVDVTGDTMSGTLTISNNNPLLQLNRPAAGNYAGILSNVNNLNRWLMMLGDTTAESGANAGSDFNLYRYGDGGGAPLGNPISINRASGAMTLAGAITMSGAVAISGALTMTGTIAAATATPGIQLGGVAAQYSPRIAARIGAVALEWGHPNPAGWGSTLGAESGNAVPYIGLCCGPGTNANTYKTLGVIGSVIRGDGAGGMQFGKVPTANADNQALTTMLKLEAGFRLVMPGGGGTDLQNTCGIYLNPPNASVQMTLESTAGFEGGIYVSDTAGVVIGSWAGAYLNFRVLNVAVGQWSNTGLNIAQTTATTGKTNGALTVAGGVGVSGGICTGAHSVDGTTTGFVMGGFTCSATILFGTATGAGLGIQLGVNSYPAMVAPFVNHGGTICGSITMPTSTSVSFNASSDIRLKTDLKPIENAGATVDAIKVYDFAWRAGGRGVGMAAQELAEVFPLAVHRGGDDPDLEPWQIDYSKLVPVLIAALQDAHRRIEALEKAR